MGALVPNPPDPGAEQARRRAELFRTMPLSDARKLERLPLDRLIQEAEHFGANRDTDSNTWPPALDLEGLAEHEPEPPRFIADDWLPCGYGTGLFGHGGIGKSIIALLLAVCIAAGLPFFGMELERLRVLYLACEDRWRVLHWRLRRICAYVGIDLASLRGWLEIVELVGRDSILWERDPRTGYTLTPAYGLLAERVRDHETELLIVDGISDTFGGNENSRGEVKRFINSLVALIPADRGAVFLLGHVAKPTAANSTTSEGYSGSTAWHNAVRARWYLYPETTQSDDGGRRERTGELILELQKSNLGRMDQEMRFRWDDQAHLFIGRRIEPEGRLIQGIRDRTEREGVLKAFRACAAANPPIAIPAAMTGPRTAYHVLAARSELPDSLRSGKPGLRRFWRHVEQLRQMQHVREASIRRANRHLLATFELTEEGMRQCA